MRRSIGSAAFQTALLVSLAGAVATVTASDDELSAPLKSLQGEWTSGAPNGDGPGTWTFDGSTVTVEFPGVHYVATVFVAGTDPLNQLDFTISEGPADVVGQTVRGIVKVEEESATLCTSYPGGPRPTSFEETEGDFRFTLSRKPAG